MNSQYFVHPLLRARDWQGRPEFTQLCDWWRGLSLSSSTEERVGVRSRSAGRVESRSELRVEREEGPAATPSQPSTQTPLNSPPGVCALVGIGGAGKTAISERFLRILPGGLPALNDTPKDETLPAPRALFVFCFYDAPNPDHFFGHLHAWLSETAFDESAKTPSYQQTLQLLSRVAADWRPPHESTSSSPLAPRLSPLLLVLDGLEKVQDDGARGGALGQLLDGRLRDLILRAADGWLPGVALLITTRFRLFDPLAQRSALYRQIDIDQLQPPAALALLRVRGVRAIDAQLLALAEESGFHALTLDLLGGYVGAFCDGDPSRLPPLTAVKVSDEAAVDDPRLAAVKEKERKFGRLAQRYREALAARDPAALALLERVCLFRLGVNADTLAAIFTGAGKETVSGPVLATLTREQVEKKLRMLATMRLLEANAEQAPKYSVHPALREGIQATLDRRTAAGSHATIVLYRTVSLVGIPGWFPQPTSPAALDALEEIVYHMTQTGNPAAAWDIYWDRLGHYEHLGSRLGDFERCHRVCRLFAGGLSPRLCLRVLNSIREGTVPPVTIPVCLDTLGGTKRSELINEWGLALGEMGYLGEAALCFKFTAQEDSIREYWSDASTCSQNLADTLLSAGQIRAALSAADDAMRFAEKKSYARGLQNAYAKRGFAKALRGEGSSALDDFTSAERFQVIDTLELKPLLGRRATYRAWTLFMLGQTDAAKLDLKRNIEASSEGLDATRSRLMLAELSLDDGKTVEARRLHEQAHEWAIARDAKEVLCWASLVRGKIQIAEARCQQSEIRRDELLSEARKTLDEGLRIARDCGYGIYHIDLLPERARLHLLRGEPQPALDDLRVALDDGIHPSPNSGFPTLLAATDPECGYAWGIAEGRHLRAQAFLLQAAQALGRPDFAPANFKALPAEVRSLIDSARKELEESRELRQRIQDPKRRDTEQVLKDLDGGVLTSYPSAPVEHTAIIKTGKAKHTERTSMPVTQKFDVWIADSLMLDRARFHRQKNVSILLNHPAEALVNAWRFSLWLSEMQAKGLSPKEGAGLPPEYSDVHLYHVRMRRILDEKEPLSKQDLQESDVLVLVRGEDESTEIQAAIVDQNPDFPGRIATHCPPHIDNVTFEELSASGFIPPPETDTREGGPFSKSGEHVFLSYCHDNEAEAAQLHADLLAAGEAVWWDKDILPGQDWKLEIRKAMKNAYAVVLCLSKESEARSTSGIYPEALDAINQLREHAPGNIFLIPVRLSDCEIPPIEIDGTRTLDRLQYADLFPAAKRAAGLQKLIKAITSSPIHP